MTAVFSVLFSLLVSLGVGAAHLHALDNGGGPAAAAIATPAPSDNGGGPALKAMDNGGGPALP